MIVTRPIPFNGPPEVAEANFATHQFGEERCWACDCRPTHAAAYYPCGQESPRETVEIKDGWQVARSIFVPGVEF
jgi:hypothetical protein